jgi:hypothetical protein
MSFPTQVIYYCLIHILPSSVHVVRWITGNCCPLHIINDIPLRELLTAGRPNIDLPSPTPTTIARDIKACLILCRERISKLLHEHIGRFHFGTDSWTSPNYRAFVAWTVHLEFKGRMLAFLLDIVELPEVKFQLIFYFHFS